MYNRKLKKDIQNPLEAGLSIFDGKWTTRIVCLLTTKGTLRFKDIKNNLSTVTDAQLSLTLESLLKNDIITRKQYNEIPLRVEYSMTEKGKAAIPMLESICKWTQKYNEEWMQFKCNCHQDNCIFDLKNNEKK